MYSLAYELKMPVSEVMDLPMVEIEEWAQFFAHKNAESKRAGRRRV